MSEEFPPSVSKQVRYKECPRCFGGEMPQHGDPEKKFHKKWGRMVMMDYIMIREHKVCARCRRKLAEQARAKRQRQTERRRGSR
jgi:hypothetical protein